VQYVRIESEAALLEAIAPPGASLLSGGTDLLVKLRAGVAPPDRLLDISGVPSLREIVWNNAELQIGAAASMTDILGLHGLAERLPLLSTVLQSLGSVQIRNRATLGGNLVNASPAADSAIPLLLYDAVVELAGSNGERFLPVSEFLIGPGKTALQGCEYVRSIRVPLPTQSSTCFFHKVGKRRALTIAIASVGARLVVDGNRIAEARFAAGSVAPTALRLHEVERRVTGHAVDSDLIAEASEVAQATVSPIDDIRATAEYRRLVVGALVARALRTALAHG